MKLALNILQTLNSNEKKIQKTKSRDFGLADEVWLYGYIGLKPVEGSLNGGEEGLHAKPFHGGLFNTDWENWKNEEDDDNTN